MKFLVCALGLLFAACTSPAPVAVERAPIIGGSLDGADPAVVLVVIQSGSLCTGEVVSPHVVITAAHCVSAATVGKTKWSIFTGDSIDFGGASGTMFPALEAHAHPDFDDANVGLGNDIGVIITKDALPMTPLKMNRTALDVNDVGKTVRFVGYGLSNATNMNSAGTKRQVSSTLDDVVGNLLQFNDPAHGTCEGDSGGPAFMKLDGMNEVIVGLTSFGTHTDCSPPGFDTALDEYADSFVQPYIDKFDPPPVDMSPVPPGPDGFPPGAIGATCDDATPCNAGNVCAPSPLGYCTAGCDPAAADACPMGTHCGDVDGQTICVRDGAKGASGCAMSGDAPLPGAMLALIAIAFFFARRRAH